MADPESRSSAPPEPSRRRGRRVAGWRGRLIDWLDPEAGASAYTAVPAPGAPEHDPEAAPMVLHKTVDLVEGAEQFATLRVSDVMTPRADIVALELSTPLEEVVRRFVDVELTRMPIYRETLDDPVGVAHIKDVVRLLAPTTGVDGHAIPARPAWREPVLHTLRRDALYVPASMRTADLLVRMRVARIHMAMVIDEFGGTDGIVTLEDLIEAVVGDIDDEHDEADGLDVVARPGDVWEADARAPLEALEAALGVGLAPPDEGEEIESVGGLVSTLAGRLPQRGEVIVHPLGFEFEVTEADPRRVKRVRIRAPAAPLSAETALSDGAEPLAGADPIRATDLPPGDGPS